MSYLNLVVGFVKIHLAAFSAFHQPAEEQHVCLQSKRLGSSRTSNLSFTFVMRKLSQSMVTHCLLCLSEDGFPGGNYIGKKGGRHASPYGGSSLHYLLLIESKSENLSQVLPNLSWTSIWGDLHLGVLPKALFLTCSGFIVVTGWEKYIGFTSYTDQGYSKKSSWLFVWEAEI